MDLPSDLLCASKFSIISQRSKTDLAKVSHRLIPLVPVVVTCLLSVICLTGNHLEEKPNSVGMPVVGYVR